MDDYLIVDSFAGGGGASTGIEMALGRSPDVAINHDPVALAMHAANHPECDHLPENVWQVDLDRYARGRPIGLLWASPDCRHFSKARGGAPTSVSVRGLAWTIVKFVWQLKRKKPRVIIMENVEEFRTWEDFDAWKRQLRQHGYRIEMRELRACDYGAPTIRKRLFIVMRCDGKPIVWPKPTHGAPDDPRVLAGKLKPYRTAAEIIDWSVPCPSIFDTSEEIMRKHGVRAVRPLAPATMKRIAQGVKRYVLDAVDPFLVSVAHGYSGGKRDYPLGEPIGTVTASPEKALVVPIISAAQHGGSTRPATAPIHTIAASPKDQNQVVAAFLAQHNSDMVGRPARAPLSTITTRGTQQTVVAAHMLSMKGSDRRDGSPGEPLPTVCAGGTHAALVASFMVKYYGAGIGQGVDEPCHSVTTRDRFGLVTVEIGGTDYVIVDIGMRMLTPRELFRAQGFPDDYVIDRGIDGKPIPKTHQVHKCGNSVSPHPAQALVAANCEFLKRRAEPAREINRNEKGQAHERFA
nr:DNA cytosine methyltransferase [Oricola thermophila]